MSATAARREAHVDAPPEACFTALTDYAALPSWQRALRAARVLESGDGWDVVEYEVDATVRTLRYTLRLRYDEPHAIDSDYVDGPFRDFTAAWRFSASGTGTRAAVEARIDPGRFVPGPVRRMVEDAVLGRAMEDLQRRMSSA
jgi:ribosome-associated toxin RatA of RatAB toxin-antitoxin module